MKNLPNNLRKNGYSYTQILRGKKSCIYEQRVSRDLCYYEVFRIHIKGERTVQGKTFPKEEVFPNNEAFGDWAWSYRTLTKAKVKFYQLEAKLSDTQPLPYPKTQLMNAG
jgi:hypothetical protein